MPLQVHAGRGFRRRVSALAQRRHRPWGRCLWVRLSITGSALARDFVVSQLQQPECDPARTSHWAASMKRIAEPLSCVHRIGDCGDSTPMCRRHQAVLGVRGSRVARRKARATSASAPIPDTTSTAVRAHACRPRRAGDGRGSADRSPGSCRSPGRRRRATAFRRLARRIAGDHSKCRRELGAKAKAPT